MTNSVITAFPETSWHTHVVETYAYARLCQAFPNWSVWLNVTHNVHNTSWVVSVALNNRRGFVTTVDHNLKNLENCIDEFITEIKLSI
jgi:hypothetical protein